jgi:hypothetical protein
MHHPSEHLDLRRLDGNLDKAAVRVVQEVSFGIGVVLVLIAQILPALF